MSFGYRILWVGRKANDPLLAAADDYAERLKHYAPLERLMVRESDMAGERDGLMKRLEPADVVVALDERGKDPTTMELATQARLWMERAQPVALLLGGADGLHPDLKARASQTLALSRLTLPHRMAQMLLLEQLYRAHTILRGEKYHRV